MINKTRILLCSLHFRASWMYTKGEINAQAIISEEGKPAFQRTEKWMPRSFRERLPSAEEEGKACQGGEAKRKREQKRVIYCDEGFISGHLSQRKREIGIDVYTVLGIKSITGENVLCSTGNSTRCSVVTWMQRKSNKRRDVCICCCSVVSLFVTPWTAACLASLPHHLLEFAQTRVYWAGDAIQPSHPLSPPSSPTRNLSHHQGLFQWVHFSHQVAKVSDVRIRIADWLCWTAETNTRL